MSVYKVIELIGTSKTSWEEAAREALAQASRSVRDLRVAEVTEMDVTLNSDGDVDGFRTKVKVSFKHEA